LIQGAVWPVRVAEVLVLVLDGHQVLLRAPVLRRRVLGGVISKYR
jgi:hypothetical protein